MLECALSCLLCPVSYALSIYGHRGARGLAPENTLIAYQMALAIGVDYVDMDINMTKDGVLVVTHNMSLNKDITKTKTGRWVRGKAVLIKSLNLKQLQQFNVCQIKPHTRYAKLFPHQRHYSFCSIPTLTEVIKYVKAKEKKPVGFQIEIKTDPEHADQGYSAEVMAKALVRILHKEHIAQRTQVQAFDFRCLRAIHRLDPQIKTAYLTEYDSSKQMLSSTHKIATCWTGGPLLKNYHGSIIRMIAALGGNLWDPTENIFVKFSMNNYPRYGYARPYSSLYHTR